MNQEINIDNLLSLKIKPVSEDIYNQIKSGWDHIAKPINGLGDFETITARIGAINGDITIDISKRAVVMMCADNGIIEEGVSQSGSDVTLAVSELMGRKESSVCKMAKVAGADTFAVDVGIRDGLNIPGEIDKKIANCVISLSWLNVKEKRLYSTKYSFEEARLICERDKNCDYEIEFVLLNNGTLLLYYKTHRLSPL